MTLCEKANRPPLRPCLIRPSTSWAIAAPAPHALLLDSCIRRPEGSRDFSVTIAPADVSIPAVTYHNATIQEVWARVLVSGGVCFLRERAPASL